MNRLILIAPLALAACNSSPTVSVTNASTSDVAKQVRDANVASPLVTPGRWESSMTITEMTIPNMPPQVAEQMKAHMGQARTHISCLTEEEAKKPKEDFFGAMDKSCRYDHFTMGGGKIDAAMTCTDEGGTRSMAMTGTYGGDTYHMAMESHGTGGKDGPMAGMAMKMAIDAKRTGACTGKEDG